MSKPMPERLRGYTKPRADGVMEVETETMLADIVKIVQAGKMTREQFLDGCAKAFDACGEPIIKQRH